jgi:hypothetical protein
MADVKISALPASTTPLTGTEVLPLVQSGTTKKVAVSNLTGTTVSNTGEVGVGGDTAGTIAGVTITSKFCVKQNGTNPVAGFVKADNTVASSGSGMFACRSRGTIAAPTAVQKDDNLWSFFVAGNDGTDLALAAQIDVDVDDVPGSNDMPGRMVFKTTPNGSQATVESFRIDNTQKVTFAAGVAATGTNATVNLSPTGTGVVTIKPTATGTMDNMQIGVTDPDLAFFNNSVSLNGANTATAGRGLFVSNDNTDTSNPQLRISARDDINAVIVDYSTVAGGPAATLAFANGGNFQWLMTQAGDLAPKAGATDMKEGFIYVPAAAGAPTENPTNESAGITPLYYDETNNYLYAYNAGWKKIGPFA